MHNLDSKFDFKYSITKLVESKRTSIEELLIKDNKLQKLCRINSEFYHGNLSKHNSEELLKYHKQVSGNDKDFFLIRDDTYNCNNYMLSIIYKHKFYHYTLENIEDAYFKMVNGTIVHGLDKLVENFRNHKSFLPCKLKNFVPGSVPPNSTLRNGFHTHLLHRLVIEGSLSLVNQVIRSPLCPQINTKDILGNTALHLACYEGNLRLIEILLKAGASPKLKDKDGKTPLHLICSRNYTDLLNLFIIEYGAELNVRNPENLWTPLHYAAATDSSDIVLNLINDFGAIVDFRNKNNQTAEDLAKANGSLESYSILRSCWSITEYRLFGWAFPSYKKRKTTKQLQFAVLL